MQIDRCPIIDHKNSQFDFILVAAGSGSRAGGDFPKQYSDFLGAPVFIHSLKTALSHPQINNCALVHPLDDAGTVLEFLTKHGIKTDALLLVEGGTERSFSVQNGLSALDTSAAQAPLVFIHDAARPGLTHSDINALLSALSDNHGAAPALPVVDTLKRVDDNSQIMTVSRDKLFRIQTPQAFRAHELNLVLENDTSDSTDEFSKAERTDLKLALIPGAERLSKLTFADDFVRLEKLLDTKMIRTGLGYDVHALIDGTHVTLCGVEIAHEKQLKGHSDADVGWHALTDAILGALAEGDIGDHFPPTDDRWKGEPSSTFLKHAGDLVVKRGGRILNLDVTLICEAPKIKPHRLHMRETTAKLLDLDLDQVSIKATTTEQLGFEGRREGISAQAIATIEIPETSRQ